MEKGEKNEKAERELSLQWGNKKRLRCVRVRGPHHLSTNSSTTYSTSRIPRNTFLTLKNAFFPQTSTRFARNTETATLRSENGKSTSVSPERYYMTRGSMVGLDEMVKNTVENEGGDENRGVVWPKIFVTLSTKEKEEDFMAMKGCRLPQRPKKRAKFVQRTLLLVSPGAWLTDMSLERYEVREKGSKKRPRGLKAMGSIGSDSE